MVFSGQLSQSNNSTTDFVAELYKKIKMQNTKTFANCKDNIKKEKEIVKIITY